MKKIFSRLLTTGAAVILCGLNGSALAQTNSAAAAGFLEQAKSTGDSQLGGMAAELTAKVQALEATLGTNAAVKDQLDGMLKSLTGGMDSEALTSAFDLVKNAQLTPEQLGLAKQVGNLASAYVVQKNFATLEGSQSDVASLVSSLRSGNVAAAIPPLKNVAASATLTDPQKQIITTVADKYAPGWQKAKGAMDTFRKLPGFGN